MKKNEDALAKLEASRALVEDRLQTLKQSLHSEVGWAPSSKSWVLLTLALSSGLALAYVFKSRRK